MVTFAERTLALEENAHLRPRVGIVAADVTLTGERRVAAGLADSSFDFVIMNPPFNPASHRMTPDTLRQQAHVMGDELFERWLRSAAAVLRPGGRLALIARPESLPAILPALPGRFGSAEVAPVQPRVDTSAIRVILRAVRGSRAALALRPALVLHDDGDDLFSARADAINNGRNSLFGD
jgi:tRNA1(Val) A37 N6-methylase TrmN6